MVARAEALGEPSRCGDVEPARRADGQAATGELPRCGHCLRLRDPDGVIESDRHGIEEPAHALDHTRYPTHDLWVHPPQ